MEPQATEGALGCTQDEEATELPGKPGQDTASAAASPSIEPAATKLAAKASAEQDSLAEQPAAEAPDPRKSEAPSEAGAGREQASEEPEIDKQALVKLVQQLGGVTEPMREHLSEAHICAESEIRASVHEQRAGAVHPL